MMNIKATNKDASCKIKLLSFMMCFVVGFLLSQINFNRLFPNSGEVRQRSMETKSFIGYVAE